MGKALSFEVSEEVYSACQEMAERQGRAVEDRELECWPACVQRVGSPDSGRGSRNQASAVAACLALRFGYSTILF